jgi:hypothetical protein
MNGMIQEAEDKRDDDKTAKAEKVGHLKDMYEHCVTFTTDGLIM